MPASPLYQDRWAAGKAVAQALSAYAGRSDVLVLGMPRGGVAVARQVADALDAPLGLIVARKVGVPGLAEVALGAIAEGRRGVVEDSVAWYIGVPRRVTAEIAERERVELERRVALYRGGRPMPDVRGRTVILVDDGLATGATLRAASLSLRARRPTRLIAAVPVASRAHCDEVRVCVDELVTVAALEPFETVSAYYDDFSQVTDADVLALLGHTAASGVGTASAPGGNDSERTVSVPLQPDLPNADALDADLGAPNADRWRSPHGLVILAHGGGSSRHSYRNRYLAGRLRMAGWATLRVDLLLEREQDEDVNGDVRFDVARIASRLRAATEWAVREHIPGAERIVLFGASTGAAAAVVTAAGRPALVAAVVARGGRVDLAGEALSRVRAPLLMVVGSDDLETLRLSRQAIGVTRGRVSLRVIRGAGHTFEEPGALGAVGERVVRWLAAERRRWFLRELMPGPLKPTLAGLLPH